jgi:hypothetical protein
MDGNDDIFICETEILVYLVDAQAIGIVADAKLQGWRWAAHGVQRRDSYLGRLHRHRYRTVFPTPQEIPAYCAMIREPSRRKAHLIYRPGNCSVRTEENAAAAPSRARVARAIPLSSCAGSARDSALPPQWRPGTAASDDTFDCTEQIQVRMDLVSYMMWK